MKSCNDVQALRKLYDATQLNVRCLVSLGVTTVSFSAMLCNILIQALPYDTVPEYHRKRGSAAISSASLVAPFTQEQGLNESTGMAPRPIASAMAEDTRPALNEPIEPTSVSEIPAPLRDMEELIHFIQIELESRERIFHLGFDHEDSSDRQRATASRFALQNASSSSSQECYLCKFRKHATVLCDSKLSLSEKKQQLTKDLRCFKYTLKGHRARDCRGKIVCSACRGMHAPTMCDPSYTRPKKIHAKSQENTTVCMSCAS